MDIQEKDEGVTALADALALAHGALDGINEEWASLVQRTINAALVAILEYHQSEKINASIVRVQDALIARLLNERAA